MPDRISSSLAVLVVGVAAAAGLHALIGIGRHAALRDLRPIERGPDQAALRRELQPRLAAAAQRESTAPLHVERAVLLVVDLEGDELQRRSFAAQIALAPLALRVLEGRHDEEIANWLRAGVAVVLDSMGEDREAAILARIRDQGPAVRERRAGAAYLVVTPEAPPR